jgi:hypothetical protein
VAVGQDYTSGTITPAAKRVSFSDDVEIFLPFSKDTRPTFPRLVSSPAGTYGGLLFDADTADALEDGHAALLRKRFQRMNIKIRENPFSFELGLADLEGSELGFTQAVDLTKSEDEIWTDLRQSGVMQKVRQAEEEGLVAERSENPAAIDDYWLIYQACQESWGEDASNDYGKDLFEAIEPQSPNVEFWTVKSDGDIIGAGPIFLAEPFHADSWLTLAYPGELDSNPYDFLYEALIRNYKEAGFRHFDFNPSGGHEGVVQFKKKFSTERRSSASFSNRSLAQKGANAVGKALEVLRGS